jgi:hypothetical protein
MLLFVDQEKVIKVIRLIPNETGSHVREQIGVIPKNTLNPNEELTRLGADETAELEASIAIYKRARDVRLQAAALSFPETVRQVIEYLRGGASDSEKKLIVSALLEGVRQIRRQIRKL